MVERAQWVNYFVEYDYHMVAIEEKSCCTVSLNSGSIRPFNPGTCLWTPFCATDERLLL